MSHAPRTFPFFSLKAVKLLCEERLTPMAGAPLSSKEFEAPKLPKQPKQPKAANAPTFVDLFCGAGGWTSGLVRAGWVHVGGVESDAGAAATYEANHGFGKVLVKPVEAVSARDFAPLLARAGLGPGAGVDLVAASPPCQSFSMVGPRRDGDPADRLFEQAVRIARQLRARTLVLENVVGLLSKRLPDGSPVLDALLALLGRHWPAVGWRVLDAADYGVPQHRRRLVVVATSELGLGLSARAGAAPALPWPLPRAGPPRPAGPALLPASDVAREYWLEPAKAEYYRLRRERLGRQYVRFVDRAAPAHTLRAGYFKSRGAEALVEEPAGAAGSAHARLRLLTELEYARLQGFPDRYRWVGPRSRVYAQIGNAVPPPLAEAVGRALRRMRRMRRMRAPPGGT